jgi:NAD(P)-dependent dehydrogenase (short-subunit alcohol dehydrogenase family)
MTKKLEGKIALVTGGSRGLGVAIAHALADEGADVAITYSASAEKAKTVVEALEAKGVRAIAIQADQGDSAAAAPLIAEVVEKLGKLDILVNNAAIALQGKTIDDPTIDNAAMDQQWAINTLGVIANIRAAAKILTEGGRIISIGSGVGTRFAFPGLTDYAATKAAIVAYSKGAARDLGARNITVNVVQPGVMATDMAISALGTSGPVEELPPGFKETHAIQRIASLNEVAAAVVYLAGPDAGYITGSVLDVNGGFTA